MKKWSTTMLTRRHYVHNVCKNVINMSKNHRHYVHLCTEGEAGFYSSLVGVSRWKSGRQRCNKSRRAANAILDTLGRRTGAARRTGVMVYSFKSIPRR